jgi:pyridoxal phosphate enzyme (YggS family)
MSLIANNLRLVNYRIDSAAKRAGRNGSDVTLVVVTKTRSDDEIRQAIECGATDIGENYVQEAEEKFSRLGHVARWHMIGHLQKNKARHVVEFADLIHSVDSEALAKEIGRRSQAIGHVRDVLIEVNISGEQSKFGVAPDKAQALAQQVAAIPGIRLCGLMGMAPFLPDPESARPYFRKLKQTWDKLPDEQRLYLSMGMTQDFETAVEEGSNMVRIGAAIFEPRA